MAQRHSAAGPLADYAVDMRVMTKEGFPGTINDIHEGPADLTTYYVTLDAGMGGGMYAEAEIWPINEQTASKPIEAVVEHTATDDYPELGSILADRLPPEIRRTIAHVASLHNANPERHTQDLNKAAGYPLCAADCMVTLSADDDLVNTGSGMAHRLCITAAVPLICRDCGDTYFTDNAEDPHHENCQEVNGEVLGAKQGFYLPLDNSNKDQKFDDPEEQRGWQDGTADGKAGVTRNIQDPTNIAYRAGYDRGWAYGVEIYRAPAGGFDLGDFQTIEQMQTVDPPTNRLSSREGGQEDLPFFEAGQLWELVKGKNPDDDPALKGHLTYNWCRYRKDYECHYSKTLDVDASQQAGYAVWTPEVRGPCYRNAWEAQEACPIALPGPNVPGGFTDATVAWEQGGQHGGVPTNVIRQSSKDERVPPSEHGDPRMQDPGVSVSKTKDGKYYVHTHRARGKYRDSVADIPDSEIERIRSTGSMTKTADEDTCPWCHGDGLETGKDIYQCQDCHQPFTLAQNRAMANRLEKVRDAAQEYADSLPRCTGCGAAYHPDESEGDLHDHWTAKEGMRVEAAQAICPWCDDTMLSQVLGMSCLMCGTIIPYCSTEGLLVLSDDGLLEDMRSRFAAKSDWTRHPDGRGWVRRDGEWYLERGAPMSGGGTAWLVHKRHPADQVERTDSGTAYDAKDGQYLWTLHTDVAAGTEDEGDLYKHIGDAGSLYEAKDWARSHEERHGGSKTSAAIPPLSEQAIAAQFEQYADVGHHPFDGIMYYKGVINDEWHVDCLLAYRDDKLVGVLNHYPMDMGPERKGNVLVMVLPEYRKQGLGKALWDEAVKRWNVTKDQDQTPSGKAFLDRVGALDPSIAFMLVATWREVQQKAKRIRSEGGVRIIASKDGSVVAHVRGDTNVYETEVVRSAGSRNSVSHWTCGCKWAAYSWGRSGPWKKYEGRMCSHALALQYEAQARNMFGREMTLDENQPEWMDSTVPVRTPNSYDRNKGRYSSMSEGEFDQFMESWTDYLWRKYRPVTDQDDSSPINFVASVTKPFPAKVRSRIVRLVIEDGKVQTVDGQPVAAKDVLFPGYDPKAGLDYVDPQGRTGSVKTASPLDDAKHAKTLEEAADDLLASARIEERTLTPMLTAVAAKEGGKMAGLDFRFKSKDSLLRKMRAEANLHPNPGQCALNMSDSLRYTMLLPEDRYTETVKQVLSTLDQQGFRQRVKNYWQRGDTYQGINVAMTSRSGHPVELQFHTDASLHTKEVLLHPLYEEWRTTTDKDRQKTLAKQMVAHCDAIPIPAGVMSITPHKMIPFAAHLAAVMAPEMTGLRFLLIHDPEDAPLALLRVDGHGMVSRWEGGGWVDNPEYGRFTYLGEPRSHEISEAEADAYIGSGALNFYAHTTNHEEAPMSAEEWGFLSDLHDVPEPALPTTDGADEDEGQTWSGYAGDPEPDPHHGSVTMAGSVGGRADFTTYKEAGAGHTTGDWLDDVDVSGADQAALAVAAALAGQAVNAASVEDLQAMAEANILAGGGGGDRDIMAAAQAGLEREALKTYSPSERQQIISEGEAGEVAGNLDRLDLSGTHYEALEARRSTTASPAEASDLGWDMLGDPNGDL